MSIEKKFEQLRSQFSNGDTLRLVDVYEFRRQEGNSRMFLDDNKQPVKDLVGRAIFHRFGSFYEEFENGVGNQSSAIVEFEDGRVDDVMPSMIVFI